MHFPRLAIFLTSLLLASSFVTDAVAEKTVWFNFFVWRDTVEDACDESNGFLVNGGTQSTTPNATYPGDFKCKVLNILGGLTDTVAEIYCFTDGGTYERGECKPPEPKFCPITQTPNGVSPVGGAGNATGGNPVSLNTGSKVQTAIDWVSAKDSRFRFTRYYRSDRGSVGDMGGAWVSNWYTSVQALSGETRVVDSTGYWVRFTENAGIYSPTVPTSRMELTSEPSGWKVEDGSGRVDLFDQNGLLTSSTWPDGYAIQFTRSNGGLTVVASDNRSQSATITLDYPYFYTATGLPVVEFSPQVNSILVDSDTVDPTSPLIDITYEYERLDSQTSTPGLNPAKRLIKAQITDLSNPTATEILAEYGYADSVRLYQLTSIKDGNGIVFATFDYDAEGRAILSEHVGGADRLTISYPSATERTTTNALGKETQYDLGTFGDAKRITNVDGIATVSCLGTASTFSYTPAPASAPDGYVYERVERNGSVTRFERDSRGLITKKTEDATGPNPRITLREWHPTLRLPTKITTSQMEERFVYDATGLLLSYTQEDVLPASPDFGQNRVWTFTYTTLASGLQVLDTLDGPGLAGNGVNDVVNYDYFASGVLQKTTSALGHITEILSIDDRGQPLTMRTPDGLETAFEYDFRGRLTASIRDAAGSAFRTEFIYDTIGQITTMTLPRGGVWSYTYDGARRLTSLSGPNGDRIDYAYDALGNATTTEYFLNGSVSTYLLREEFDELGRILKSTGADGQAWNFRFDEEDNLDLIRDPLNNIATQGFDALNRLIQTVDERGETIAMTINDNDAVTGYTDPRGLQTTTEYNGFGEVVREVSPDQGVTLYSYDSRGLVVSLTDARNVVANYAYDDDGRLAAISYPASPGEDQVFTYDQVATINTGRLTTVTDESGQTTREYNNQGLISSETRVINGFTYQTQYAYDAEGLLDILTYPSGLETRYTRNTAGEVTAVDYRPAGGGAWTAVASGIDWLPFGDLAALTHGNGVAYAATYDASYRLQGQTDTMGATPLRDVDFGYTARDNLVSADDLLDSLLNVNYSYDTRQMLAAAAGPWGDLAFDYDPVGNRIAAPGLIAGTAAGEVIAGTAAADIIRGNGGHYDDITGGGGADLFDFAGLAGNGVTDFAVIRDYGPGDGLNFGGAPFAFLTGDSASVTIILDGIDRDVVRVEAGIGTVSFNDIRIRPLPLGIGAPADAYTYAPDSNRLTQVALATGATRDFTYGAASSTVAEVRTASTVSDNWAYTYNDQNRLTSVSLNGVEQASYLYNFAGQQVVRTVWQGGVAVKTVAAHDVTGSRLGEYDGDTGALLREYIWLDGLALAVVEGGQLYHLSTDQIGRPVMAADSAGAVVWAASYLPFGGIDQVTADTGALSAQELRFPGQWFQAETGLHQNWMRDYDPTLGRYLQADPLGLVDGPSVYGYARQSPMRFVDPTGEFIWLLPVLLGGGVGVGIGYLMDDDSCYTLNEALFDFILGAAGGVGGFAATGIKTVGKEFSHAIPARAFKKLPAKLKKLLDGRNSRIRPLNGNYVTPRTHSATDPFRLLLGQKKFGEQLLPLPIRIPLRTPGWLAGASAFSLLPNPFGGPCGCPNSD